MNDKEINYFFECIGEIWRDITAMEFLMRSAITKIDGEEEKFPLPPYNKGKTYSSFPNIFKVNYFSDVVKQFNEKFGDKVKIPIELVNLRNAMAHGIITQVNDSPNDILIKFRKNKEDNLEIEFSLELNKQTISQIRQSLKELRRHISKLL